MKKHILLPYAKYQSLLKRAQIATPTTIQTNSTIDIEEQEPLVNDTMAIDQVIAILPKIAQKKAMNLLHLIQGHIQWDNLGRVIGRDGPIAHSHIADLVKYTVVNHFSKMKPPSGSAYYFEVLDTLNIPRSLKVNKTVQVLAHKWHSLS